MTIKTKTSLLCGAALGTAAALAFSASAEAKTVRRPAAPTAAQQANAELKQEVSDLRAMVQALNARLDAQAGAQAQAQAATQAQLAQTQTQVAETRTQVEKVVADSESVQDRLDNVPTQVLATLSEVPKPPISWTASTTVSGRMYFDVSHLSQKSNGVRTAPSGAGFDIKRFYVGIDHKFNDTYSANVTTDFQYSAAISSTHLFLKKAYLQGTYSDALTVRIGAADLPWVPFVEDLYGYRYLEQVMVDRTKTGTSSDWGVHALGKLGPYVSYAVAVVDGAGYKAPLRSKGMDIEGRISAKYNDFTVGVGGYSGKLGKNTQGATNVFHTATRFNLVGAYVHGPVRVGAEYFSAKNWNNVTTVAQEKSDGYSMWASYQINPQYAVFGKYERVKPRKTTAPRLDEDYFNFGIQYEPTKIVDLSLVYKRDRVDNGTLNTGNGLIGGPIDGTYDEVGLFGQLRW